MVVTPEGGACHCEICQVTCAGRFPGCSAILSMPGRRPPTAPLWAVEGDPSGAALPVVAVEAPEVPAPGPSGSNGKAPSGNGHAPSTGTPVAGLVPARRGDHHGDLEAQLDAIRTLAESLAGQVAADRRALHTLARAVLDLSGRVAATRESIQPAAPEAVDGGAP